MTNATKSLVSSGEEKPANCVGHGIYISKNIIGKIWSRCPRCVANEFESEKKRATEDELIEVARRWESKLKHSSIPPRFAEKTLCTYKDDSAEQKKALEFCLKYSTGFEEAKKTGKSAIFCGQPGTGKTHLAIGIALEAMKTPGNTVLFVTAMRMVRRIKSTWDRGSDETETQAVDIFTSPDLLILDEIGVQFGSETEENLIFDVINHRYENKKPIIIISNLDLKGVKKYLGERAFDRLREDGGKSIPFSWGSYR